MLSAKMKAKKLILLFVLFITCICDAGTVHHVLISTTEQKMMGHTFKHVMTSGGAEKDQFFIDGRVVAQDIYLQKFEQLQKKEWEEQSLRDQAMRRSRIEFADMVQVEIAAKLVNKLVMQLTQLFEQITNPALEPFYVFTHSTIDSQDQLHQLKDFVQQLDVAVQKKIVHNDFQGLQLLVTQLEHWPERLEKFFQNTVHHAIKKSDDTMMLKELLKLVC